MSQHPEGSRMSAGRVTGVWAALVATTVLGWWISGHGLPAGDARLAGLIGIASAKIWLVMATFMGLWRAPVRWHLGAIAWLVVTGAMLFVLFSGATR